MQETRLSEGNRFTEALADLRSKVRRELFRGAGLGIGQEFVEGKIATFSIILGLRVIAIQDASLNTGTSS